jgi:hypothetical protein
MSILKISELVEGKIYTCRLSGLKLLVRKVPLKWIDTFGGKAVSEWAISCLYFSPVNGTFMEMNPIDNQLVEISQEL